MDGGAILAVLCRGGRNIGKIIAQIRRMREVRSHAGIPSSWRTGNSGTPAADGGGSRLRLGTLPRLKVRHAEEEGMAQSAWNSLAALPGPAPLAASLPRMAASGTNFHVPAARAASAGHGRTTIRPMVAGSASSQKAGSVYQ